MPANSAWASSRPPRPRRRKRGSTSLAMPCSTVTPWVRRSGTEPRQEGMLPETLLLPEGDIRGAVEAGRPPLAHQAHSQGALGIRLPLGVVELPDPVELVVGVEHPAVVEAGQQRLAPAIHGADAPPHQRIGLPRQLGKGEPYVLQPPPGQLFVEAVGGATNLGAFRHMGSLSISSPQLPPSGLIRRQASPS